MHGRHSSQCFASVTERFYLLFSHFLTASNASFVLGISIMDPFMLFYSTKTNQVNPCLNINKSTYDKLGVVGCRKDLGHMESPLAKTKGAYKQGKSANHLVNMQPDEQLNHRLFKPFTKITQIEYPIIFVFQEQFEFALTAVAEEVNAILKALPQ